MLGQAGVDSNDSRGLQGIQGQEEPLRVDHSSVLGRIEKICLECFQAFQEASAIRYRDVSFCSLTREEQQKRLRVSVCLQEKGDIYLLLIDQIDEMRKLDIRGSEAAQGTLYGIYTSLITLGDFSLRKLPIPLESSEQFVQLLFQQAYEDPLTLAKDMGELDIPRNIKNQLAEICKEVVMVSDDFYKRSFICHWHKFEVKSSLYDIALEFFSGESIEVFFSQFKLLMREEVLVDVVLKENGLKQALLLNKRGSLRLALITLKEWLSQKRLLLPFSLILEESNIDKILQFCFILSLCKETEWQWILSTVSLKESIFADRGLFECRTIALIQIAQSDAARSMYLSTKGSQLQKLIMAALVVGEIDEDVVKKMSYLWEITDPKSFYMQEQDRYVDSILLLALDRSKTVKEKDDFVRSLDAYIQKIDPKIQGETFLKILEWAFDKQGFDVFSERRLLTKMKDARTLPQEILESDLGQSRLYELCCVLIDRENLESITPKIPLREDLIRQILLQIAYKNPVELIQRINLFNVPKSFRVQLGEICKERTSEMHIFQQRALVFSWHKVQLEQSPYDVSVELLSKGSFDAYVSFIEFCIIGSGSEWNAIWSSYASEKSKEAFEKLKRWLVDRQWDQYFEKTIKKIEELNDFPQKQRDLIYTTLIACFIWTLCKEGERNWIFSQNLLETLLSIESAELRLSQIFMMTQVARNPVGRSFYDSIKESISVHNNESMKILMAALISEKVNEQVVVQMIGRLQKARKSLKDGKKQRQLMSTLSCLAWEQRITTQCKERILRELCSCKDDLSFLSCADDLLTILQMNPESLENNSDPIPLLLKKTIIDCIPDRVFAKIQEASCEEERQESLDKQKERFYERWSCSFGQSSFPMEIFHYIASFGPEPCPEDVQEIADFMISVLNGSFLEDRYSQKSNPHLAKISDELLALWKMPISLKNEDFQEARQIGLDQKVVVVTDDPHLLLRCSRDVGSCLSRAHCVPLLDYIMSGQNQMVAVLDSSGRIQARAILRLLLDENNKPVLFLEPVYGNKAFTSVLIEAAQRKAAQMKIPLAIQAVNAKELQLGGFERILYCHGGRVRYGYSDSAIDGVNIEHKMGEISFRVRGCWL